MYRVGSCFGPPASQHSEWPLWRPSAAALRPLLQLLPLPLFCRVQATTSAGSCWAPPKTNSRTSSSCFTGFKRIIVTISPSADSVSLPTPVAVQCQAGGPPSPPYYWHTSSPEELAPSASFPSAAASAAAPAPAPAHHSTAPSGRSSSPPPSALHDAASHVNLVGCSACEAPRHDDSDHVAFTLTAAGGRSLLLSHRETACVVAIMEVISRCSAPITASAAPSPEIQDADANQRRQLFDQ